MKATSPRAEGRLHQRRAHTLLWSREMRMPAPRLGKGQERGRDPDTLGTQAQGGLRNSWGWSRRRSQGEIRVGGSSASWSEQECCIHTVIPFQSISGAGDWYCRSLRKEEGEAGREKMERSVGRHYRSGSYKIPM